MNTILHLSAAIKDTKNQKAEIKDAKELLKIQKAAFEKYAQIYGDFDSNPYNMDLQRAILYFGLTRKELETLFEKGICDATRDKFIKFAQM